MNCGRLRRMMSIGAAMCSLLSVLSAFAPQAGAASAPCAAPLKRAPEWNAFMAAGNQAAYRADLDGAIRSWSKLFKYAHDRCSHEIVATKIRAAQEVRAEVRRGTVTKARAFRTYQSLEARYWVHNACNRP